MPTNVLQFAGTTTRVLAQPVPNTTIYEDCEAMQKLAREWASADARSHKLLHQTLLACLGVYKRVKAETAHRQNLERYAEARRIKIIENLALLVLRIAFDRGQRPTRATQKQQSAWAQAIIALDIADPAIPSAELLSDWGVDQLRRRANQPISRSDHFERRSGPEEEFGEADEEGAPERDTEPDQGTGAQQVDAETNDDAVAGELDPMPTPSEAKLLAAHGMKRAQPIAKVLRELDYHRAVYLKVLAGRAVVVEGGLQ